MFTAILTFLEDLPTLWLHYMPHNNFMISFLPFLSSFNCYDASIICIPEEVSYLYWQKGKVPIVG